jgi:hypothetical protein
MRPVQLHIPQKDPAILSDIQEAMDYTGPLSKHGEIYCLQISNQALIRSLEFHGIRPGPKSKLIRVPKDLEFKKDFVRGYFDGDGHGGWRWAGKEYYLRVGLTSASKKFLMDIKKVTAMSWRGPYTSKNGVSKIELNGWRARAFQDWIYSGESKLHIVEKKARLCSERPQGR